MCMGWKLHYHVVAQEYYGGKWVPGVKSELGWLNFKCLMSCIFADLIGMTQQPD